MSLRAYGKWFSSGFQCTSARSTFALLVALVKVARPQVPQQLLEELLVLVGHENLLHGDVVRVGPAAVTRLGVCSVTRQGFRENGSVGSASSISASTSGIAIADVAAATSCFGGSGEIIRI